MKKTNIYKRAVALAMAFALLLITPINVIAEQPTDPKVDIVFFGEVLQYIEENYPFEVSESELLTGAVKGMLESLDPHSNYYTKDEATELIQTLTGNYAGIGVYIEVKEDHIEIIDTMKDSPGEKAGLKSGDKIISVDGKDFKTIDPSTGTSLIKGVPGTKVKLGILRGNKKEPIYIEATRKVIKIDPVQYEILDNEIAYVKINEFNNNTTSSLTEKLKEIDKHNVEKIIIDLRDNPGGYLDQAVGISKLFIPKGPIVHIRHKDQELETYYSKLEKPKYKLVVLVNEYSASASEIFAGAVKDTKSGTIVGTTTYGKGTVQTVMPLKDGSILKLTTAEYLTPNKTSINGKGVVPDITVENKDNEDSQLKKAIELFK